FVGPSGSGKSTLIKLLVGLYQPINGQILFNDVASEKIRYNPLRRQMGFVTQDTQLFAGTIKDNLLFVKTDATDDEIIAALHKASHTPMIARTDKGINTIKGDNRSKPAGGDQQRTSRARRLLRKPRLLIFDEDT